MKPEEKMKRTFVFVILDEQKLQVVSKHHPDTGERIPIVFDEYEWANDYATQRLSLWTVIPVQFTHPHIQWKPNIKWIMDEFNEIT